MKFIHTADIHLGASPDRDLPWGEARRLDVYKTFEGILNTAREEKTDLLLIAGDLFHRPPVLREVRELAALFSRIPDTQVVLTAGNHDHLYPGCAMLSLPLGENVHLLDSQALSSVTFPSLKTVVHGFSYHQPGHPAPFPASVTAPKDGMHHILMLHGGDEQHLPLSFDALASSGFDYIALGHIHQPRLFERCPMAYCGSPEPMDRTDTGRRGYIKGSIDDSGVDFRFIPSASGEYRQVTITVNPASTSAQITDLLREKLDHSEKYFYRIILAGERGPDIRFDPEIISMAGQISDITDRTVPSFDIDRLLEEHSHDLISHYIRKLSGGTETEKKALFYGLAALLDPEG